MPKLLRLLPVLVVLAVSLAACGGDDDGSASSGDHESMGHTTGTSMAGAEIDRAFVAAMIPHHESAIEMAEIAKEQGESDFVKQLADDIISAQESEIETLTRVDGELESKDVEVGDLGVPEHMQGMEDDPAELRDADPFDRMFVDMMVPHHEGAIEMAKVELEKGENEELKSLAQDIVDAQQREIDEMNEFREKEYGAPVSDDSSMESHGG